MPLPDDSFTHFAVDLLRNFVDRTEKNKTQNKKNDSTPKEGGAAAGRLEKRTKMYSRCYVNERLRKMMKTVMTFCEQEKELKGGGCGRRP
jgi:hypothetical protein